MKDATMLTTNCTHCGELLEIPEQYLGQRGTCKHCKGLFLAQSSVNSFTNASSQEAAQGVPRNHARLENCSDCGGTVSKQADACPHCGKNLKRQKEQKSATNGCIALMIVGGVMGWFIFSSGEPVEKIRTVEPERAAPAINIVKPAPRPSKNLPSKMEQTSKGPVEAEIRSFAQREYPNDLSMQNYIYNQQLSSYLYMQSTSDFEVKQIAESEYPNDYSMQQYVYDNQIASKRYMATVTDIEVIGIATNEYPNDYSMQQYVYDQQIAAKHYMNTVANSSAASQARREYPNDFTMQKYIYDRYSTGN
jgi:hypothetical protein